ncbi:SMC-Scp complex subunit ScpB [Candidatus Woesearchaeota archaeon B3_Woes]|nr:MAG: SMC-Scp complex subunit ScpB [Candidatus Woesearchaeota archaeon B3_Woes]
MDDIKNKVEALLFSSGKALSHEEIKRLCRLREDEQLNKALQDLKVDYDNRDSSLILVNEGDRWKITTKENYFHVVKKVVTETELSKTLMETLAVIAWKYPIKQADLIKIRTNKAYDHLRELESIGYITRQKHGRTKLIKLTDKFFSYFDLPPDKLKEKFSDFSQIAKAISDKEIEIEDMKKEHQKNIGEAKKMQEEDEQKQKKDLKKTEKEIDLIDDKNEKIKLDTYETTQEPEKPQEPKKTVETYESEETKQEPAEKPKETKEEQSAEERPKEEAKPETPKEEVAKPEEKPAEKKKEEEKEPEKTEEQPKEKPKTTQEKSMDEKADELVEKLLHPEEKEE